MLKLTKRTEYGLIALLHLAERGGEIVSVREIGERYGMPRRLLAEVLKDLAHEGLVRSQLGASGGYRLAVPADRLTLGAVVATLEGVPSLMSCEGLGSALKSGDCEVKPACPIRSPLQVIRQGIWTLLQNTTLRALADSSLDPPLALSTAPVRAAQRPAAAPPR